MFWIDQKYISLLSNQLRNFKKKDSNLYNFSCPICNDSDKIKTRARGYLIQKTGKFFYFCHNCSASMLFSNFLKQFNSSLYDDYIKEKYVQSDKPIHVESNPDIPKIKKSIFNGLRKVSQLPSNHYCKQFIVSRQIPTIYHSSLYFVPKFKEWTNSIQHTFDDLEFDEPRLIIPLLDTNKVIGFQGRALKPGALRYITIMISDDYPKVFGLDKIDFNEKYFVLEGPFDSMFLDNSIATCGGKLTNEIEKLGKSTENAVFVYDNEPRNKQIVNNMFICIEKGYKICIWPDTIQEKNINDMILNKVSGNYCMTERVLKVGRYIENLIDENTVSGLEAELKLYHWRKC